MIANNSDIPSYELLARLEWSAINLATAHQAKPGDNTYLSRLQIATVAERMLDWVHALETRYRETHTI